MAVVEGKHAGRILELVKEFEISRIVLEGKMIRVIEQGETC